MKMKDTVTKQQVVRAMQNYHKVPFARKELAWNQFAKLLKSFQAKHPNTK